MLIFFNGKHNNFKQVTKKQSFIIQKITHSLKIFQFLRVFILQK